MSNTYATKASRPVKKGFTSLVVQRQLPILIKNSKIICTDCKKRGSLMIFGQIGDQQCSTCWLQQATIRLTSMLNIQNDLANILDDLNNISSIKPCLPKIFEVKIYEGIYPTCYLCCLSKETMVTIDKKTTTILQESNFLQNYTEYSNSFSGGIWGGSWNPIVTTIASGSNTSSGYFIPQGGAGGTNANKISGWTTLNSTVPTLDKDELLTPKCFCVLCARKFTRILGKQIKNFLRIEQKESTQFNKVISKIKGDIGALSELLEESAV